MPDEAVQKAEETASDETQEPGAEEQEQKTIEKAPKILKFTQPQLDDVVQKRIVRERKKILKELGIDGDWQEALSELQGFRDRERAREEEEREREEEVSKKRGEFEKIENRLREQIQTGEREAKEREGYWSTRYDSMVIDREFTDLYLGNGGFEKALPDALAAMRNAGVHIKVTEGNELLIRDADGSPVFAEGTVDELTAEDFVKDFLRNRPYFTKAAQTRGSDMPTGLSTPGVPLNEAEQDRFIKQSDSDKDEAEIAQELGIPVRGISL